MSDQKFQIGDPPTDRGPIVGIPQDDLLAKDRLIEELKTKLAKAVHVARDAIDTILEGPFNRSAEAERLDAVLAELEDKTDD